MANNNITGISPTLKSIIRFGLSTLGLAALFLFLSSLVPVQTLGACYGDGLPPEGCPIAGAGWPFAFIHDGYTSPIGSADLMGWFIGSDLLQPLEFKKAGRLALLIGAFITAVIGLTRVEITNNRKAQYILKPLAAALFLAIPTLSSLSSSPDMILVAGLFACAVGDILLLPRDKPTVFKVGMLAFALGHIAYTVSIFRRILTADDMPLWPFALTIIATLFVSRKIYRWLKPHLPPGMNIPVIIYTIIIGTMVSAAVGSFIAQPYLLPMMFAVAAMMFAVSDVYVARDRFIENEPKNARRITPLYFGAQLLFAILAAA